MLSKDDSLNHSGEEVEDENVPDWINLAKLCEAVERYDDMRKSLQNYFLEAANTHKNEQKSFRKLIGQRSTRNLFSSAYRNLVGPKRAVWQKSITQNRTLKEASPDTSLKVLQDYARAIRNEIEEICGEVIEFLNEKILPQFIYFDLNNNISENNLEFEDSFESQVFYLKMRADYCRYLIEICPRQTSQPIICRIVSETSQKVSRTNLIEITSTYYNEAYETAVAHLSNHNPERLGLCLNYAVFYYEIIGDASKACFLAKSGIEAAIKELHFVSDREYTDTSLILQLLRDNLVNWSTCHCQH